MRFRDGPLEPDMQIIGGWKPYGGFTDQACGEGTVIQLPL